MSRLYVENQLGLKISAPTFTTDDSGAIPTTPWEKEWTKNVIIMQMIF